MGKLRPPLIMLQPSVLRMNRPSCTPGAEQICSGPSKSAKFKMIPPVTLTCISADGCGRSVKIAVEGERVTMRDALPPDVVEA